MNANNGQKQEQTHIRLILPKKWLKELDVIARSRLISRLALIRHYIQLHINDDLEKLREQLATVNQNKRTVEEWTAYQARIASRD